MFGLVYRLLALFHREDGERGATAVEYGIMVALIAAVIITIVTLLGNEVSGAFNKVTTAIPG